MKAQTHNLAIQWGAVDSKHFGVGNHPGDWNVWDTGDTRFDPPYTNRPAVLVTAVAPSNVPSTYPFPVGIARDITSEGFRLEARNSTNEPEGDFF